VLNIHASQAPCESPGLWGFTVLSISEGRVPDRLHDPLEAAALVGGSSVGVATTPMAAAATSTSNGIGSSTAVRDGPVLGIGLGGDADSAQSGLPVDMDLQATFKSKIVQYMVI
jgi:hypothetical protein